MPEDNQIQPGFQPENQVNSQIQQDKLVQNQQQVQGTSQQVNQQNNMGTSQQNLSQDSKTHKSWLTKILTGIFFLLGFGLIGFGIYDISQTLSHLSYYYDYSIWDIITSDGTWAYFLVGITFTIIGMRFLFLGSKLHTSWFTKIISGIFRILGIISIGLGLYGIFQTSSDWFRYDDFSIRDLILESGIWILGPLGILFIIIGILYYYTEEVDIYYHPSRLTKILSGIYRFIGIALVWAGLWNFSLIGTDDLSFLKILYVGGSITLCGILYILLGRLLYSTKNRIPLGVSLLYAFILSIIFTWILNSFTDNNYGYGIDSDHSRMLGIFTILFTLFYFSISSIKWSITCRKYYKKGIINPKYLDSVPSKKKIGIITTVILLSIIIVDLIYGKIQWSKIPEVDESIFNRDYHQTKLPDEEDALVQLRAYNSGDIDSVFSTLDSYYLYLNGNSYTTENNKDISWKWHPEECIVINTGGNEYCGTWAWDKDTLKRSLNNYFNLGHYYGMENHVDDDGYLSIDGKKVTVFEYIQKNEPEIRETFRELDSIVSLDYYLPDNEILNLIPQYFQGFTRASMVALQYYIQKEDRDMVMFIIKLNYKIIDIFNTSGSVINQLISITIQGIIDSSVNSYVQLFPKDFRIELLERYSTQIHDKSEIYDKMVKGEYVVWNRAKAGNILGDVGYGSPSLSQFLFHFPFFSSKEINNLMNYSYYLFWNSLDDTKIDIDGTRIDVDDIVYARSLYNRYGKYPFSALMPRMQSINDRIDRTLYHKDAIIKNLESGKYDARYGEPDWESDPYNYENYRMPTDKNIIDDIINKSTITNQCFGREVLDPHYNKKAYSFHPGDECAGRILLELKKLQGDKFGLKEVLVDITKGYINHNEALLQAMPCLENLDIEGNCKNVVDKHDETLNKLEKSYIELIDILENIKDEVPEIDVDEYFYIPEMIYDIRDELINTETDNTGLNNTGLNHTETNNTDLNNSELSGNVNIIFKNYSDITNPCFGEDIIDPHPSIGRYHNEFEEACLNTLKELKGQEDDEFGLKEILIELTKSLINHSKFDTKIDACWLEEGALLKTCDEIFDKGEELINKVKENYTRLSEILKNIEDENQGLNMDEYFYIPYKKINDKTNRTIVSFIVDQEKAEKILNEIKLQESTNNN